jgi:hypothetical protein
MPMDCRTCGKNSVCVLLLPSICHQRLVVYSANTTNTTGWAIRDFIANSMLDDEHSGRSRAAIEAEVLANYSEYPPFYNVEDPGHAERWEVYLVLRTLAHFRRHSAHYDTTPVAAAPGDTWMPILPVPPWVPLVL